MHPRRRPPWRPSGASSDLVGATLPLGLATFGLVLAWVAPPARWPEAWPAPLGRLPVPGLSQARRLGAPDRRTRLELVLLYVLFYGYGVGGAWNFAGHFFAADMVASSVGWAAGSPFQQELAFYALGTGTVGLLTPWIRDRFWLAAALAPSIFVYGAAFTHVEDYLVSGNDAPMNWSFTAVGANLLIPTAVLALTWVYARMGGFSGDGASPPARS